MPAPTSVGQRATRAASHPGGGKPTQPHGKARPGTKHFSQRGHGLRLQAQHAEAQAITPQNRQHNAKRPMPAAKTGRTGMPNSPYRATKRQPCQRDSEHVTKPDGKRQPQAPPQQTAFSRTQRCNKTGNAFQKCSKVFAKRFCIVEIYHYLCRK